jgi:hypothetical protein
MSDFFARYILNGKIPEVCDDLMRWAEWLGTADRTVARTEVGPLLVSTVFLGSDHNWEGGPPLLFETMVFRPGSEDEQATNRPNWISFDAEGTFDSYATWEEAEAGHARIVQTLRKSQADVDSLKPLR